MEEKIFGRLSLKQADELVRKLNEGGDAATIMRRFMKKYRLPFMATDRSVLNLPAIGKSMSFKMIGMTDKGRRILCFTHDHTRRHSPIIDHMGDIFIVENKSLSAYLRQLHKMGENVDGYQSIWNYTQSDTEPRFELYNYPDFDFEITSSMSNLSL